MFKGRHFDRSVILLCVRWYLAYGLSLRDLKEMMAERGMSIDRSTLHRSVVHFSPVLLKRFNRRKRTVGSKWHMDETYIKVRGQWMYLYRAIDSVGDTVEFWFSEHRDLPATKRFLRRALQHHGRPDRIVIDGSQTNRERSSPAMPRTGCGIGRGGHRRKSVSVRANISTTGSSRTIGASSAGCDRCWVSSHSPRPPSHWPASRWFT